MKSATATEPAGRKRDASALTLYRALKERDKRLGYAELKRLRLVGSWKLGLFYRRARLAREAAAEAP